MITPKTKVKTSKSPRALASVVSSVEINGKSPMYLPAIRRQVWEGGAAATRRGSGRDALEDLEVDEDGVDRHEVRLGDRRVGHRLRNVRGAR